MNPFSSTEAASKELSAIEKFVNQIALHPPAALEELVANKDAEVWQETDCLKCANCCKTMTPRFTHDDVVRISSHLGLDELSFRMKYLLQYANGEWVNLAVPCQFLQADNRCEIYEQRPEVCAGFPYHLDHFFSSHKEQIASRSLTCPATFRLLQKLKSAFKDL